MQIKKRNNKMKEYSIDVNLTEEDLYDLENGGEFNWSLTANENENVKIKIHLFKSEEEDFGE